MGFILCASLAVGVVGLLWLITQTLTLGWSGNSVPIGPTQLQLTANGEDNRSISVAGTTTNQQTVLDFTTAGLQLIVISSNVDVTIKTNSTGSPQDTLAIKGGKPFVWYANSGVPIPFAGNVTTIYITNAGSVAATVDIRILVNT